MKDRVVKSILFDLVLFGKKYKDLDYGYHNDPEVTENYIYSEDGPWSSIDLDGVPYDIQINDWEGDGTLDIDFYEVETLPDGEEQCGHCLDKEVDYKVSNIRVEYCS